MLKFIVVSIASIALAYGIVHVVFHILPRLFPYQPVAGQTRFTLAQLERLYQPVEKRARLYWIFGWIVPTAIWYLVLRAVVHLVHASPDQGALVAYSGNFIWAVIAAAAGFATAHCVDPLILRRQLGRRYGEYRLYRKWQDGRLERPLLSAAMGLFVLATAFVLYSQLTIYTLFDAERIAVKHWLKETRNYSYRDIAEIRGVSEKRRNKHGETYDHRWYEIEFYDGFVWHMAHGNRHADPCGNYPIFAFAADKSRRAITGLDHFADLDCHAGAPGDTSDK